MASNKKSTKSTGIFPKMAMCAVATASFMDSFCYQIIVPNLPFAVQKVLSNPKLIGIHNALGNLIEVSESEQFTMGTNVLSIGQKRVFSLPMNRDVNYQIRQHGYEVLEVDFSEIIKSGGSFRCCSMPIVRL